jgi:signal transduction histidine kinase
MSSAVTDRLRRPWVYVAAGLVLGLAYAFLNTQTDDWAETDWARADGFARSFFAFHAFVDRGIPVLAGALLGLAFHWLQLRSRLARAEALRADELRSRLRHVERDQAAWVVAASTLHELKNPLHAMGLLVDELEEVVRSGDPVAVTEQLARVRRQMDRALVPLDALRSLTRQGQRERKARPIGVTAAEVVDTLRPLAAETGIELRLEGDRQASTRVDAELVRIILDNLVANALEGSSDAPRARSVEVRIVDEPARSRVVLRVSDDGPGVPEARRATLFEPLRTDKSNGLGLGLPIARALARTLGGELAAVDVPGFATSFELVVPVGAHGR